MNLPLRSNSDLRHFPIEQSWKMMFAIMLYRLFAFCLVSLLGLVPFFALAIGHRRPLGLNIMVGGLVILSSAAYFLMKLVGHDPLEKQRPQTFKKAETQPQPVRQDA